ncbi:hypothetical protein RFI_28963 [Reticulomyxa filosa]|uniref:EF-hand domain-containing protein n=1 Tax=Reticulomyxa filosa TaxID=46433 RepID=X6M384_RETFI|nr:hypothetical protein RFI_28963 [Reticulomyxa filosa]|eukprot:ETO08423.1 hypothetical protein RFI_28963 [Reticulomyxa filosa]
MVSNKALLRKVLHARNGVGLILMFFGGQYAMTIVCYTALQISGSQQSISLSCLSPFFFKKKGGRSYMSEHLQKKKLIYQNYESAKEAFENDETARKYVDENNDGQISSDELVPAARKFLQGSSEEKLKAITNLKAVILAVDPQEVFFKKKKKKFNLKLILQKFIFFLKKKKKK